MKLLPSFEVNNYANGDVKLPNNFWTFVLKAYAWCLYNNNDLVVIFGLDPNYLPSHSAVLEKVKTLKKSFAKSLLYSDKSFDYFMKFVYGSVRNFINKKVYWCFICPIFNKEIKGNIDIFIRKVFKLKFSLIEGFNIKETDIGKLNDCINNFSEPYTFIFDDSSYVEENINGTIEKKFIEYIIIYEYRFLEEFLILIYVYFELINNLLVESSQRTDVSIFCIVQKVMTKIDVEFSLNSNQIKDKLNALNKSLKSHVDTPIGEILNGINTYFESSQIKRDKLNLISNIMDNVASNSRKYKKYFTRNESLDGRRRLHDDVLHVLKESINNRCKNKLFNLEYMCNPYLVAPLDVNNINLSIFDNNYLSYDVDYFNFFMRIEDIPQIVGHRWEASSVITPKIMHSDYPKVEFYKNKKLNWPEIDECNKDNIKFICLSQDPMLYCPSRNCFNDETLNNCHNIVPSDSSSESEHSDSDITAGNDDDYNLSDNGAFNNNALIDYASDATSDDDDYSGSNAESDDENDQVIMANEDPTNFIFQKLFGDFDTKYIKSGHSINIQLGDSNKMLYTTKTQYEPDDLVQFLRLNTKNKYRFLSCHAFYIQTNIPS